MRSIVAVCAALALSSAAPRLRDAAEEPPKEIRAVDAPPLVAWSTLAARPLAWLGKTVRVRVQHHSRPTHWNPYITRFAPGAFAAEQAWADEQLPWIQAEYEAPAVRVFARKGCAANLALAAAKTHERFEVTAIVREIFVDVPWLEVVDARVLANGIGEAAVIHAARALELSSAGAWQLAELEFEQALAAPLPAHAQADLEARRAAAQRALRGD